MNPISIKCENRGKFEKVKLLLQKWGKAEILHSDAENFIIHCVLPEDKYKYIKRKWTIGVIIE